MKKKALLTGFVAVILGIAIVGVGLTYHQQTIGEAGGSATTSFPKTTGPSGTYALAASFPVVNDTYPVYRTVTPKNTDEEIRRIGNLFGLSGESKSSSSGSKVRLIDDSKNPAAEVWYYPDSGAFQYCIPDKMYPKFPDKEGDLPSDKEARKIVMDYLMKRNLLPEDVHFAGVSAGSQYEVVSPTSTTVYNLSKHVSFIKEIQGIPVYNAGVGATINEKGDVVIASGSLREIQSEPVRYAKISTPEQAYQRLISEDVVIKPLSDGYDEVTVSSISLGYWMEIKTEPQKYVMPVYVFTCTTPGGTYRQYVSAVDPSEMQYLT